MTGETDKTYKSLCPYCGSNKAIDLNRACTEYLWLKCAECGIDFQLELIDEPDEDAA